MEVFRITHKKWSNCLSGSGFAARWNSQGIHIVYTADSRALACLENIVHRESKDLHLFFILMRIMIPPELKIIEILPGDLPDKWYYANEKAYKLCRPFGDLWIKSSDSAVLKVPSAIIPGEFNYLINPAHEDFKHISIISEESFFFDERIKEKE